MPRDEGFTGLAGCEGLSAPAVNVEDASLAYHGRILFDRLSLRLPPGKITSLLGPSGVGKSSLVRLVAGLTAGAAGRVCDDAGQGLEGRLVYMAQQDLLFPWLSVLDNVLLGWRLRGDKITPEQRARGQRLLERVGLGGCEDLRRPQLSGGMRQRVALARTLMENRPVVLMDEPFSGLDAITRYELQALTADVLRHRTVLLVTHDPLEALRMSHRMLVLSGRPARLNDHVRPPDTPLPRQATDPEVMAIQADLLESLTAARARTA